MPGVVYCPIAFNRSFDLAAQVFSSQVPNWHLKPERESQLRPLLTLNLQQAQQVCEHAVKTAGGRRITARLVNDAVTELQLGAKPAPVTQEPRVNKAEQRPLVDNSIGQLPSRAAKSSEQRLPPRNTRNCAH